MKAEDSKKIRIGDFVRVRDTGRYGEVADRHGRSVIVAFPDSDREETVAVSLLERIEIPEADAETVRGVVRGEIDVRELTHGLDYFPDMRPDVRYKAGPEDLLAGFRKWKDDPQSAEIWTEQLLHWNDLEDSGDIWPEIPAEWLLSESFVVYYTRLMLDDASVEWENEEWESFRKELLETESLLETWKKVGADLNRVGEYPEKFLNFLVLSDDEDSIDRRSRERQEVFRACLEVLCERGNQQAIKKRGYCYYCGTRIYPQDWYAARDTFTDLYRKTGSPITANTLGYIYYYGRCNGGVPEYDKAFYWFSIGYAGGMDESTYKLGDLFANGFGVVKNEQIARSLYGKVYQRTLPSYLRGIERSNFADAAIRIGNCFRDGINCIQNLEMAYGYYLQARTALEARMASSTNFGDDSVKQRLDETIREIRKEYTEHSREMVFDAPQFLDWFLDRDHKTCRMKWQPLKNGRYSLTFSRAAESDAENDYIMVTFPAGDYCELVRKIQVKTGKDTVLKVKDNSTGIVFDHYMHNCREHTLVLYRDDERVAEIKTEQYRFRPKLKKRIP